MSTATRSGRVEDALNVLRDLVEPTSTRVGGLVQPSAEKSPPTGAVT
jgi:hypothetical protein